MEIEFNLDVILKKKKIGLREAARICELSYPTIQKIAGNKSNQLSLRTIEKLCNGLGVKLTDLFREKEK
ncbi:MAG: helix-turn-helix transcriptional regulator [Anaerolineae bacterium]|jgi:DNA-binding Xre family transcriptional regulator|nr:helix-turn-helix transcriptional regulator [Anaerolineae bacterium]